MRGGVVNGPTVDAATSTAVIRRAVPNDWEAIGGLLAASSLPLDGAREHLGGFVVAVRGGALVGCAAVERYRNVGLLRSVAVASSEKGKGSGAALVSRCIADAREAGIEALVLLTTTAELYFPRFGFDVIDRAAAPDGVRESAEFRGACPASATVMRLVLSREQAAVFVRTARLADAPAIAAIYNAGIRGRMATFETRERTVDDVAEWFARDGHPILVAERAGHVIGWVGASPYRSRDCYVGIAEFSVYVDPAVQGQRVGDALMRAFVPALEAAGFWKVLSRIFPENVASRALCRRHGFREVGVYEKHARLDGAWRDVVIVERLLGADA